MTKIEQNEQIAGNIQTAIFTTKDNGFQSIKYFFTYHIKSPETFEQAFERLEPLKSICKKYIWGEEYGKSGNTPHIQGAFILESKMRATSFNQFFFYGVSLFKLKNWDSAFKYCQKEGNNIISNVKIIKLDKLECEDPKLRFEWQDNILNIINKKPDNRSIFWYFSREGGRGKTIFCKYLVRFHSAIILSGKADDMKNNIFNYFEKNGYCPEFIVVNIPKSNMNYISYTGLENIKDMLFFSGKYEGGMIDGNSPHLFVFSNAPPDFEKMTNRFKVFEIIDNKGIPYIEEHSSDDENLLDQVNY